MRRMQKWKNRSVAVVMLVFLGGISLHTAGSWPSDIPKPDDETVATKVDWIWENVVKQTVTQGRGRGTYTNFIDQLHADAAMGTFQVCIRWHSEDSRDVVSSTQRDVIEGMLQMHMKQWIDCLAGYDGWPWATVPLRISGWAGYNAGMFEWTEEDNGVPIYLGDDSFENAPQCPQSCGRFFHTAQDYTYPNCPGEAENHYDWSSWHSRASFGAGGHGSDWGQRTPINVALSGPDRQHMVISHEMGHGFYLPDFYTVSTPGGNPSMVMVGNGPNAPSEYDKWLLRRVYSEMKRQSGRLPEIDVTSTVSSKHIAYRDKFSVTSIDGRIRIKTLNSASLPFQIRVYDQSGRSLISSLRHGGDNISLSERFARGMYLVKITSDNLNEVHRVNIFY